MKKYYFFTILAVAGMVSAFAQKKINGNIYITHPAITVVEEFGKAFEAGDSAKMASYLTADFKFFDGTSNLNNFGEVGKAQFLSDAASFKNRF
ncbi:MAG: nuclear transport factor 2 family protein, partial [Bacteroidetes bacterium]|nr:nuclear transport factor 2 family protein [Bacteroidota bacterium]